MMLSSSVSRVAAVLCFAAGMPTLALAQQRAPTKRPVSIYKFSATDRRQNIVKTPVFTTSAPRMARQDKDWGRVLLQYKTYLPWLDEMTVEYFVMTMSQEKGRNVYSFYTKKVRYTDIKQGDKHVSAVYLRPEALERFGPIVAAAVEVSVGGEVIAKQVDISKTTKTSLPTGEWWRDDRVVKSAVTTKRTGYLLNRAESPWALINIDSYQTIR